MGTLAKERPTVPPQINNGGPRDHFNGGGGDEGDRPVNNGLLGLGLFLIAVTMLFTGFTSAYIISRSGPSWQSIPMPKVLWLSTAVLLLSSLTLEGARQALRRAYLRVVNRWLWMTALLGGVFVAGQLEAWHALRNAGVYLPTNPHSSFFYVLTGLHGLHFLGGIIALAYVLYLARGGVYTRPLHQSFNLCTIYWHFLDGLWLYLFWIFLG